MSVASALEPIPDAYNSVDPYTMSPRLEGIKSPLKSARELCESKFPQTSDAYKTVNSPVIMQNAQKSHSDEILADTFSKVLYIEMYLEMAKQKLALKVDLTL